jgi:hypothetical protein
MERTSPNVSSRGASVVSWLVRTIVVAILALALVDVVFRATFPTFVRLRYNFSAAYLSREIAGLRDHPGTIVLGDSTVWGFGVSSDAAAISLVRSHHPEWTNLAYAGGGPVNTLAMIKLLLAAGVRPQTVVFNVNEKQFNSSDSAFGKLYPAVEQLAWPLLSDSDRARLTRSQTETADARIDRWLGTFWALYGMRSDVRDALFGDADAAHALQNLVERWSGAAQTIAEDHRATPDKFEGTYDLAPLEESNASFSALLEAAALLKRNGIRSYAILAPTNHKLLHDYIDGPEYAGNLKVVTKHLAASGVIVLNYDHVIPDDEFIDNDHLNVAGNRRLAALLETSIAR